MRKWLLGLFFAAVALSARSQHAVTFRIEALPDGRASGDTVFLAGSFNGWQPAAPEEQFRHYVSGYDVRLSLPAGSISYKLTRGSWAMVETNEKGEDITNRTAVISKDTMIRIRVAGWKDRFAQAPRRSSALPEVRIMDAAFPMPQLARSRRIWIRLPKNYESRRRSYPVLYLHDGQNIFEDSTAFSGEWGVDEALDSLEQKTGGLIVVGIDHGGSKRLNEYNPYDNDRFGKGEGAAYTDFLVHTLKPWIDQHYRTRRGPADTWVAGSSMGGLISLYAVLRYPQVFGGAGVFSPAFWIAPELKRDVLRHGEAVGGKLFFYAGGAESTTMVSDMESIARLMEQLARAAQVRVQVRPDGKHNEPAWRAVFPDFIQWLMKKPPVRPMPKF